MPWWIICHYLKQTIPRGDSQVSMETQDAFLDLYWNRICLNQRCLVGSLISTETDGDACMVCIPGLFGNPGRKGTSACAPPHMQDELVPSASTVIRGIMILCCEPYGMERGPISTTPGALGFIFIRVLLCSCVYTWKWRYINLLNEWINETEDVLEGHWSPWKQKMP